MNNKNFSLTVAFIFLLVAIVHFLRIVLGWSAVIAGWEMPLWVSWIALLVAGSLSYLGFKLSKS